MKGKEYQEIIQEIINQFDSRKKDILVRRFGLLGDKRETLEKIGKSFNICRERVRQIEKRICQEILEKNPSLAEIFSYFLNYFREHGQVRKEETLLKECSNGENENFVFFLLSLRSDYFQRFTEKKDYFALWTTNISFFQKAKKIIKEVIERLRKEEKILSLKEINNRFQLPEKVLSSYLEISKTIIKTKDNFYGLKEWPTVNPRRIRDKIYLLIKEKGTPFHFKKIHELMPWANINTIHNELIKDERFVLVGRGIYALKEWGYFPGTLKEIIFNYLKEKNKPLSKEEIIEFVLKQRFVKKFTILQYLSDRTLFIKKDNDKYYIREA